jgi:Na+-driven multidrug efflux pump
MNLIIVSVGFAQGISEGTEIVIKYAISTGSHVLSVSYYRIMGVFTLFFSASLVVILIVFSERIFALYTNEEVLLTIINKQYFFPLLILGPIMFR